MQSEHVLEVRVCDNGTPPLNSTSRIVVQVGDENDNKPEFLEKFYKVIDFLVSLGFQNVLYVCFSICVLA